MSPAKTTASQLQLVASIAQGLEDCGVKVEAVSFQAPDAISEAVAVLHVRGNPVHYRLAEPDHDEFEKLCPHCHMDTIWRFVSSFAGQQFYRCARCGREEMYGVAL